MSNKSNHRREGERRSENATLGLSGSYSCGKPGAAKGRKRWKAKNERAKWHGENQQLKVDSGDLLFASPRLFQSEAS